MAPTRVDVPARTRSPDGETAAYVLPRAGLLVDPGGRTDALDTALAEAGVGHVAVTHHHPDHVGALAACAADHDLTVWARAGREDAFAAATGRRPDRTFRPGDTLPGGVGVLDTPGHAPEHVAFAAGEALLTGDLAVAEGSVVVGAPEGDVRAYLTSLRRVRAMSPERLLPAHGPAIEDPAAACERLLAHRLAREARVRAAVEAGARSLDAVLAAAYDKDLEGLRDLARATVRAHLAKLAHEGAVTWDGEHARPA